MTLLFCDSFDHYATADITRKWTSKSGSLTISAVGRQGGSALVLGNSHNVSKTLPGNYQTLIVGFALNPTGFNSNEINFLSFLDSGTLQVVLNILANGTLRMGGTLSTNSLNAGGYYYIETKVTIDNTVGSVEVRVNGTVWISASGIDTQSSSNATANTVRLSTGVGTPNHRIDDLYICDTAGAVNNDFLGDVRIDALFPDGAGTTTNWTPSAGSNYQNVDETTPDDDTTYNSSGTVTDKDTYTFGNLPSASGTVKAVAVQTCARKDDAGARSIASVTRSGGTDYNGATNALGENYLYYTDIRETDPNTASAWSIAGVNAAEHGAEVKV